MSWFARSLVNTLVGDDDDDNYNTATDRSPESPPGTASQGQSPAASSEEASDDPLTPTRGVKEDISELTKTLTRQFWGVASFLAPPPSAGASGETDSAVDSGEGADGEALKTGIRSDLAEIGGKFRSGISILSQTKAVTGISKIASSILELGLEDGERLDDVVGLSEEVVMFVGDIAMHEDTWLDFPLPLDGDDEDDFDDFVMSDAQEEHALAIERLVPRLAALRLGLCPTHMSEGRFWTIYFVLLFPQLSVKDAELLSTPQITRARALLLQSSHSMATAGPENPEIEASTVKKDVPTNPDEDLKGTISVLSAVAAPEVLPVEPIPAPLTEVEIVSEEPISVPLTEVEIVSEEPISAPSAEVETVKHPVQTSEVTVVDKAVIEEEPPRLTKDVDLDKNKDILNQQYDEEDVDDWLEEETGEDVNIGNTDISIEQEEDVSFSDLEEDDK